MAVIFAEISFLFGTSFFVSDAGLADGTPI